MGCCKKKKAASSLAPSDKYHRNPQGGHRHNTSASGGGGEANRSGGHNHTANNNNQFSHNGIPPSARATTSVLLHPHPAPHQQYDDDDEQQYHYQHHQPHDQLIQSNQHSSPYQFYPATSSLGSSSVTSSSQHHLPPPQQPPYLLYKSNHSSSGGSSSGNGSHHIVIDGSQNGSVVVDGSNNKFYYYYNGQYYPATATTGEELSVDGVEDPEQIFTITATQTIGKSSKPVIMGRVGEDMYPPGSPATTNVGGSVGTAGGGGSGLFKSRSGSIPMSITGSPQARGFRDTFVSSMNHGVPLHAHSAESSPLHRSASATTANHHHHSDRFSSTSANISGGGGGNSASAHNNNKQESNKKWTFGGLFRRNKSKSASSSAVGASLLSSSPAASSNNNLVGGGGLENGGASSANNSNCNSPAKISNNNYATGSPIISRPVRTSASPARPASSVGFISIDPSAGGHSEIHRRSTTTNVSLSFTPTKFVNTESQTRTKGKLSESDISTCDSDFELAHESLHDNPPEPAPQENKGYKQNFLVRRLSRRKEKAAAKKAAAAAAVVAAQQQEEQRQQQLSSTASASNHNSQYPLTSSNGFVPSSQQQQQQQQQPQPQQPGYLDVPQMKRRVGSSPDSLNNSSEPWPSCWEATKKPQSQLQALQHQLLQQNYSSNGSLSVSQEGGYNSNNNSGTTTNNHATCKSSRATTRARAIARRESFLQDSSSSDDDTEERSRSSLQGSFSSLNSRNRRQRAFNMQQAQFQQQRHLFPATTTTPGISCASPSSPMPVPLDYRSGASNVSNMSPNMNRRLMMMGPPGSPKWEARLIYQQQHNDGAIPENGNQPVMARLSRKAASSAGTTTPATTSTTAPAASSNPNQMSQNNGDQSSFIMATEMISEDQHVVTVKAGLKVPFLPVQNQPQQQQSDQQCSVRNGQLMYPDDPVQYANVANGMRGRSCTPYTATTSSSFNNGSVGAIHHASPTPPPPPPPRRDFTRAAPNNPNFYRPVSCSYLDSYANQVEQQQHQQQQAVRHQSPMMFNGNYIYPLKSSTTAQQYQGQDNNGLMNGFSSHSTSSPVHNLPSGGSGLARSSPRHFIHAPPNNNQPDVDGSRHPPLIRSPSEPPNIRAEQIARISSPVKRLVSSPMSNGNISEGSAFDGKSSPATKNVITSKLGFPVRRLQEASKLASSQGGSQTPVHVRASEFWRKKESEVTGSPSPVGGSASGGGQKKHLSRIRSADSSPLPVPKMRKSPGGIVASNESISSLSSFSENAASPGPPKNCSSPIVLNPLVNKAGGNGPMKATPIRAHISKTPNPQQLVYGNNSKDKENNNTQNQSAVERLKVRIPSAPDGIKSTSSSTNPPSYSTSSANNNTEGGNGNHNHDGGSKSESVEKNPIRALIELNNGKTPGKNLEDALNELEDMYKSLRLSDEDLLDRAERRDLPTPHQELRDAPLIPIPQAYHRFEYLGSVESLGTGSGSSGTNYTALSAGESGSQHPNHHQRVRAPPVRRSIRPDTISDDMANRRLAFPDGKPLDPRVVVAKTGSYLARSPAFSPCTSPCPPDSREQQILALALLGQEEPDVTLDDVSFRNYKRANAIRIIEPQPLFGIPLGPISAAPANDYLHSKPSESYRPIFGHLKNPDIVNDDIAFRNLRKDLGQEAALTSNKDWTPRLFSPTRDVSFNYPKDNKKLRAIRSLSANITHMMPPHSGGGSSGARESPTNLFHNSHNQYNNISREIGKWNSFSDLHRRVSAGSPARASTYLQPSWVEQIEKVQTSTETLTDNRNSSRLSTAILDPPEHWERKFPTKTVDLTPPIYDPAKPRRPWTDIILESFEKEKEREMERQAAEAAAAAEAQANEAASANNKIEGKIQLQEDEDDDDVFMDASDEASKSEAAASEQAGKNNYPGSLLPPQQSKPNMDNCSMAASMLARPLPLLPGQKTRRGSWVEPSRSFSSTTTAAMHASQDPQASTSHGEIGAFQDRRRKSWSDLPKDIDSSSSPVSSTLGPIIFSGSSCSSSPTRKLFNPLPPPKKIRQINLEAFNNNNNSGNNSAASSSGNQQQQQLNSHSSFANAPHNGVFPSVTRGDGDNGSREENSLLTSSPTDKVRSTPTAPAASRVASVSATSVTAAPAQVGEDELNELMDQLLKDADACSQSIRDEKASLLRAEGKESRIKSATPKSSSSPNNDSGDVDKSESISTGGAVASAEENVNTLKKEMKMDGSASSSEQSCKQDLSCTIVGIIPKHQSSLHHHQTDDCNRTRVQQHEPSLSGTQREKELDSSSPSPTPTPFTGGGKTKQMDGSRGSKKMLKTDNSSNGNGNVVGDSCTTLPKEQNDPSSAYLSKTTRTPDSSPIRGDRGTNKKVGTALPAESSIEDLIESINESLPELEASCGGSAAVGGEHTHSSDGKPNDSSSASGSPASSIPSPSPGSPTPHVVSLSVTEKETHRADVESSSAFPVAAKRHHVPGKIAEESLYENLPVRKSAGGGGRPGNDPNMSSSTSPPFPCNTQGESRHVSSSNPFYHLEESTEEMPPLFTTNKKTSSSGGRCRETAEQRASHRNEDEDFNEEEETQHSNNSSHQLSSLSSNDSSEVGGGCDPRENKSTQPSHQQSPNSASNNNIKDNISEDQANQTCSSSSLPSSIPSDAKQTSSNTNATAGSSSSFDTFTTKESRESPTTRSCSTSVPSSAATKEPLIRKKSEGENSSGLTSDDDEASLSSSSTSVLFDWFNRWNGILLFACYLIAFLQSFATFELLPGFGIFVAILVFFAYLL